MVKIDSPSPALPSMAPPGLITDFEEIKRFDQRMWEVTQGLPIKIGSIARLPSARYADWGIGLTNENQALLEAYSRGFYSADFQENGLNSVHGPDMDDLISTRMMEGIEARMMRVISNMISDMIVYMPGDEKKKIVIADIAAKNASLCLGIASKIYEKSGNPDIGKRIEFHIVYPSASKLENTKYTLRDHEITPRAFLMDSEEYLANCVETDSLDFIVSMPFLHRYSFPDFARYAHDALTPGGAIVSGDIHSPLWSSPHHVYKMLRRMGLDRRRLDLFSELFGDKVFEQSNPSMSIDELSALESHTTEWLKIADNVRKARKIGNQRVFILGAHDTSAERNEKLSSSGLVTTADDIRRAFPLANLHEIPRRIERASDYAVISTAMKKAR